MNLMTLAIILLRVRRLNILPEVKTEFKKFTETDSGSAIQGFKQSNSELTKTIQRRLIML